MQLFFCTLFYVNQRVDKRYKYYTTAPEGAVSADQRKRLVELLEAQVEAA